MRSDSHVTAFYNLYNNNIIIIIIITQILTSDVSHYNKTWKTHYLWKREAILKWSKKELLKTENKSNVKWCD